MNIQQAEQKLQNLWKDLLEEVKKTGTAELDNHGVLLASGEHLREEQKGWCEEDPGQEYEFEDGDLCIWYDEGCEFIADFDHFIDYYGGIEGALEFLLDEEIEEEDEQ